MGLYYYRARYCSPRLGRFLQTDPVGYDDDVNLYAYVINDPINETDSTGMAPPGCGAGTCKVIVIQIRSHEIRGAWGRHHQFVTARDPSTGRAITTSAGPSGKYPYPAAKAIFNEVASVRGSSEKIKLVTEFAPAERHSDTSPSALPSEEVPGSTVTLRKSIDQVESKLQAFNDAVDSAKIDYRPKTEGSNAYAGTAFRVVTGRDPPEHDVSPGLERDLRPQIPKCQQDPSKCN